MRRAFGQGAPARCDPSDAVEKIHLYPERLVVRRERLVGGNVHADVEVDEDQRQTREGAYSRAEGTANCVQGVQRERCDSQVRRVDKPHNRRNYPFAQREDVLHRSRRLRRRQGEHHQHDAHANVHQHRRRRYYGADEVEPRHPLLECRQGLHEEQEQARGDGQHLCNKAELGHAVLGWKREDLQEKSRHADGTCLVQREVRAHGPFRPELRGALLIL